MNRLLRVLLVEDNPSDAGLVLRELRRGGYEVTSERVESADGLRAALQKRSWDIVLSDWSMPSFDAPAALGIVQQLTPNLPFIIISGTIGEEIAVEAMRAGAHDFIAKTKLTRLVPAVEREVKEAGVRKERRGMQEQLLVSDRMASVGMLAAGVAHEINNPLAALLANLDFTAQDLMKVIEDARSQPPSADIISRDHRWAQWITERLGRALEPLQDARESAERVRNIVKDLKIFSRAGDEERRGPVDLRRVIESSLRMAWNEIRHRARLVKDYADVPPAYGNESRIGQVILNLVLNAAQALPEGRADKNEIRIRTGLADAERVFVEVRDTGSGIPPDVLPRIFDAFVTTKPVGVGTGLGLSISHRIVTALGGDISVQSDLGVGTVFRVLLPIATEEAERPSAAPRVPVASRCGRILVIDDEPMVCTAIRRMLASEHDVVAVSSAREGLERISGGEHFDAILCDLMMPEMTGMDLHAELDRLGPGATDRLIFITGGAFTHAARAFLDRVSNARLEKPFDLKNLRVVVQSLLR